MKFATTLGFEPKSFDLKSNILPLDDVVFLKAFTSFNLIKKQFLKYRVKRIGFEPTTPQKALDLQSNVLNHLTIFLNTSFMF